MQINQSAHRYTGKSVSQLYTHEGAVAQKITPYQELRRSVCAHLLWEDSFYESGQDITERIKALCAQVTVQELADLCVEVRHKMHLRHAPLLLLAMLAKYGSGTSIVSDTIEKTISRADELTEFVAIYAKVNGVAPDKVKNKLSAQVKKGLARAFCKFDAYQLAKYNRDKAVKLRDVLFLCHATPKDEQQAEVWRQLANETLPSADTWEVALSSGADKKATFERLIEQGNLGYMALLKNLRGMQGAGVSLDTLRQQIVSRGNGAQHVLPFRYIAAARATPALEPELDQALCASISDLPPLSGETLVLVDISGSMDDSLSRKSDLTRADAAAALASVINGKVRVVSFSSNAVEVPPRKGMAGVQAILTSQTHSATYLGSALAIWMPKAQHDRIIVITDEQAHDKVPDPDCKRAYMINVGTDKNGVGYGKWINISGFSENVIRWIYEYEALTDGQ